MATIFKRLDVGKRLNDAMTSWHPDLVEAGVTVECFSAAADAGVTPALRQGGYPAVAVTRIVPYRDRVAGMADAHIYVDFDAWHSMDDEEKLALLDHELTHLELVVDKNGDAKLDASDRPRLRIRRHDIRIGVFISCMKRHGKKAIDAQAVVSFLTGPDGQMLMEFAGGK